MTSKEQKWKYHSAGYAQSKEVQIVKNCWNTPAGKDFIELLQNRFGDPKVSDSDLKTFVALGEFQVIRYIDRALLEENIDG